MGRKDPAWFLVSSSLKFNCFLDTYKYKFKNNSNEDKGDHSGMVALLLSFDGILMVFHPFGRKLAPPLSWLSYGHWLE